MPRPRRLPLLVVLLGLIAVAVACGKRPPLRLGLSDWPGHAPFYAAGKLGHFGGTQVEIKEFSTNFDRNQAFAQGRLDVLATPLLDAIRIADQGVPLKVVLLFDASSGGDGIVAREPIAKVADLKGKRVSAELGAITHFVLLSALERAGVAEGDVQIVNLAVPEAAEAFERGQLDAAAIWNPHLSRLAARPGARTIFTSKEIPGQVLDVLIVHKAFAEQRPDDVKAVVAGWQRSLSAWKERPRELEAVMAEAMRRSPESLRGDLADLEFYDVDRNRGLHSAAAGEPPAWRSYAAATAFMSQHKLIKGPAPVAADVLDARFLDPPAAP